MDPSWYYALYRNLLSLVLLPHSGTLQYVEKFSVLYYEFSLVLCSVLKCTQFGTMDSFGTMYCAKVNPIGYYGSILVYALYRNLLSLVL